MLRERRDGRKSIGDRRGGIYWFASGGYANDESIKNALRDVEVVVHLAASVGVGQSMYMIKDYVAVNTTGTATIQCLWRPASVE